MPAPAAAKAEKGEAVAGEAHRRRFLTGALLAGLLLLVVDSAQGLPRSGSPRGSLPGTVTTSFGLHQDYAHALALQPDGKIVAAGIAADEQMALARYRS